MKREECETVSCEEKSHTSVIEQGAWCKMKGVSKYRKIFRAKKKEKA